MNRRGFLGAAGVTFGSLAGCAGRTPLSGSDTPAGPRTIHVDAGGIGWNPDGSENSPYSTISRALAEAGPGDRVHVHPGEYVERVEPPAGGEPGQPITITGPRDAILKSSSSVYNVFLLRKSHVHLRGLTIDGLEEPDAPDDVESYSRAQLVQVRPPTDTDSYLEDVVVAPHRIGNTQKSLVSIERTRNVEVGPFQVIGPAGAKYLLTDQAGHNGEIVYLGTSPSNLGTDWHPWTEYDGTHGVRVHHIDNSAGHPHSELVNAKLGTHDVTVEYCTDGGGSSNAERNPAASIRFQSFDATLRWCDLRDGQGYGVEVASFEAARRQEAEAGNALTEAERRGGTDHAIYGNRISGFDDGALNFEAEDVGQGPSVQRYVCENEIDGTSAGDANAPCPPAVPEEDGVGHLGGESPW